MGRDTAAASLLNEVASCGRLDQPPREDCYIALPDSFGCRFAIFVDTEEDFDWQKPFTRDQHATGSMLSMPAMHDLMRGAGAKPVYLVDYPIAADPASVEMLRSWIEADACTIGTQLHPWVNPPFTEEVSDFNSFTGNLPVDLQRAKLKVLTDKITESFGRRPVVYRAGRYGVGAHTASLLIEQGYKMDTSVRASFDYRAMGGANFAGIRPNPYWVGDGALLEIPLSSAFTGLFRRKGDMLYPFTHGRDWARRLMARSRLLARVAITPEDMPLKSVLRALEHLIDEGVRLITISFHSPSVEPGHTPYVRTAAELAGFFRWWDGVFDFLARKGIAAASIEEIFTAAEMTRPSRA